MHKPLVEQGRRAVRQPGDARSPGPHAPIYFFHIPKTGGRTIERYLSSHTSERPILKPRRNKAFYAEVFLEQKHLGAAPVDPADPAKPDIASHFAPFSLIEACADDYYKVCFWRHPADWFLSLYNYRHHRNAARIVRNFEFWTFCRSMLRNPMTEHLLLFCAAVPGIRYFLMSDREKFRTACSLIDKFDRFEDISKVNEFLAMLQPHYGGAPQDYNRIEKSKKVLASIDVRMRKKLETRNSVDYYLHQIALGRDKRLVVAEAERTLKSVFDLKDLKGLVRLPYFRFKVWVTPFMQFRKPSASDPPAT